MSNGSRSTRGARFLDRRYSDPLVIHNEYAIYYYLSSNLCHFHSHSRHRYCKKYENSKIHISTFIYNWHSLNDRSYFCSKEYVTLSIAHKSKQNIFDLILLLYA
jgi:hypothetical protein